MEKLVLEMKSRYNDRYVLFDTPPVLLGADTLALTPYIDSIVMVVEEGRTTTKDVKRAIEMIPKEKFLGFVLNRRSKPEAEEYYNYYRR